MGGIEKRLLRSHIFHQEKLCRSRRGQGDEIFKKSLI
jgi:hypothetical protein